MQRFMFILLVCACTQIVEGRVFAQCQSATQGTGFRTAASQAFRSGFNGNSGFTNSTATSAFTPNWAEVHHAKFVANIRQTAARQAAASQVRFQRYVAAKNAYRARVLAEAAALSKEPRFSRREQLRQRLLERNQQKSQDRITRDARQLLAQRTYNGR